MNDWDRTYARAAFDFLAGRDPYLSGLFGSPPWSLFGLVPLAWLPSQAILLFSILALFYLSWRQQKIYILVIVGLSFPFIAGTLYRNIEWVMMLGVALGGRLGVVLDTIKPQSGVFAIVAELAKKETWKERAKLLLPLAILVVLSAPLIPSWLHWLPLVGAANNNIRNFSLFPYTIPIGIVALWYTWKRKDPLLGVVASLCFSPYFYIHSTLPLLYLLTDRNWKWGVLANIAIWVLIALIINKVIPIEL